MNIIQALERAIRNSQIEEGFKARLRNDLKRERVKAGKAEAIKKSKLLATKFGEANPAFKCNAKWRPRA